MGNSLTLKVTENMNSSGSLRFTATFLRNGYAAVLTAAEIAAMDAVGSIINVSRAGSKPQSLRSFNVTGGNGGSANWRDGTSEHSEVNRVKFTTRVYAGFGKAWEAFKANLAAAEKQAAAQAAAKAQLSYGANGAYSKVGAVFNGS